MHVAAFKNRVEILKELLSNKELRMARANDGSRAIRHAVFNNHPESVKLFLEYQDQKDIDDLLNLIRLAAVQNKVNVLKVLIQWIDKSVLREFFQSNNVLFDCVSHGAVKSVQYLLDSKWVSSSRLKDKIEGGKSLLHVAVDNDQEDMIRYLVKMGLDYDCMDRVGETPLMYAAGRGAWKSMMALINLGANTEARDNEGWTALFHAVDCKQYACLKILIENGADLNKVDDAGMTLLHTVSLNGDVNILKFLLKFNVSLYSRDNFGHNALHFAVMKTDNIEMLIELLKLNISMNQVSVFKRTPLEESEHNSLELSRKVLRSQVGFNEKFIECCLKGDVKAAKRLRVKGAALMAQLSAQGKNGKYPLEIALDSKYKELSIWLFQEGADLGTSNPYQLLKYLLFEGDLNLLRKFCSKYSSFIKTMDDLKVRVFVNKLKISSVNKQKLIRVLENYGMKYEVLWYQSNMMRASAQRLFRSELG